MEQQQVINPSHQLRMSFKTRQEHSLNLLNFFFCRTIVHDFLQVENRNVWVKSRVDGQGSIFNSS